MELAQDVRMAMGASGNLFERFPDKPPGMHWSTYQRKRERAEQAQERSLGYLAAYLDRTRPAWRRSAVASQG